MNRIIFFRILFVALAVQVVITSFNAPSVSAQSTKTDIEKSYSAAEVKAKWRESGFRFKPRWKVVTDAEKVEEFGVKFEKALPLMHI